jgi:FixJ family two-component response regulator
MIRGLRAGARGYLLKDTSREALLDAVRAAARGETLLQPDIMTRVLSHVESVPVRAKPRDEIGLTEREIEVLMGVARGERNKEIAARLNIANARSRLIWIASTTSSAWTRAQRQSRWQLNAVPSRAAMVKLSDHLACSPNPGASGKRICAPSYRNPTNGSLAMSSGPSRSR